MAQVLSIATNNHENCHKQGMSQYLGSKIRKYSDQTIDSIDLQQTQTKKHRWLIPEYNFKFGDYKIGESVIYEVELSQTFKILNRTICEKYQFRTQYSKLQKLNQKLKCDIFPKKKWFGNQAVPFIEKRKILLQNYLNKMAKQKSSQFFQFVEQIKQFSLALENSHIFLLPD